MPTYPEWFLKLPEIIRELKILDSPVIDRSVFESAFGVGRRRAIQLMHQFGGYQVGKTFIIDRFALIRQLEAKHGSDEFNLASRRKIKILEELDHARKLAPGRKVRIVTAPDVAERKIADLPAGVHLRPGELRIEFFGTEDLLRHLFELSQAVVNDYAKFQQMCELPDV